MRRFLLCSNLFLLVALPTLSAQSRPKFVPDTESTLTAEQTAATIGVLPTLQRLQHLASDGHGTTQSNFVELIGLDQSLLRKVTAASLQVDATMGEIDAEIAETRELENYLVGRRQQTIDLLNLASLGIGGSLGSASASLGLTSHTRASGVLGVIAGASTTALSVVNLGIRHGQKAELEVPSNMLARIFDLPSSPNNIYPEAVARFMNTPAPVDPDGLTREQRLLHDWVRVGRLPALNTKQSRDKMVRLASRPGDDIRLSIGDLDDRQNMLYDFRARITFMKRDLAALIEGLPELPLTAESPAP